MTDRHLSPEERHVWNKVARTVAPRKPKRAKAAPTPQDFATMMRLPPSRATTKTLPVHDAPLTIDKKTRRGRVVVTAKLDLHDLTRDQARPVFVRAVMRASKHNKACLLVITGKGLRLEGVLRQAFQQWVNEPDIRPHIASYAPAHQRHGGSGAWYVFLK